MLLPRHGEAQPMLPSTKSEQHPLKKRGAICMKSFLMGRFFTRGAGFVSTRQEQTLKDLGILNEGSRMGYRLAGEYAGRYLLKLSTLSHTLRAASPVPCLHFSADASRVCGKEVVVLQSWAYKLTVHDTNSICISHG